MIKDPALERGDIFLFIFLLSFLLSFLLTSLGILIFRKLKISEMCETRGVKTLDNIMKKKTGTPTMGGIFILASVAASIFLTGVMNYKSLMVIASVFVFALIGFVDDFVKLKKGKGISIFLKLLLQIVMSCAVSIFLLAGSGYYQPIWYISAGYMLFILLWCNAVNIADGIDGLSCGCYAISMLACSLFIFISGATPHTTLALSGACAGFLLHNFYPARIFMGNTGSMALGAGYGVICLQSGLVLEGLLIGGVFLLDFLSVIVQVVFYKLFRKRIFPITPIHHYFQLKGMSDSVISLGFWFVSLVFALCSVVFIIIH